MRELRCACRDGVETQNFIAAVIMCDADSRSAGAVGVPDDAFMGDIQRQYLALMEQNLPVADAFFKELRKDGYFVALPTRDTILMMVNLVVGTTYTWALTGEGSLEQQAADYMKVLIRGLR